MTSIKVNVKWMNGKKTLEDVELFKSEPPILFKTKILSLTGVPVERQKLMFKGATLKDDIWPINIDVSDGAIFMLMGSSEKLPEPPAEKPKFVEDMNENELAAAIDLPAGLTNLGNTCYLSATIQCLRTVPEFRESLKSYDVQLSILETISSEPNLQGVTASLRDLYANMDNGSVYEPIVFLKMIHNAIPRFAQRGEGNTYQQQDANECWTELMRILQQNLKPLKENPKYGNFVDQFFGGTFEASMRCDETTEELETKSSENFLQLSCFISQDVRYMQAGLISRMQETITKFSPTLNRDASYTKVSRISRLPAYLTIQFVRFHYKGNVQTNAKLLRDVKFSMTLDVHDLCATELQERLAPMRQKYKVADDRIASSKSAIAKTVNDEGTSKEASDKPTASKSTGGESTSNYSLARGRFLADDPSELAKYTFQDDPGSNNSGFYELKAVLTHKGRSSASGHYVAWIKRKDQWYKCDDDLVDPVDADDVLKLSGGGDWHCAYVCLYGPRFLDLDE